MLKSYYAAIGGMPLFSERAPRGCSWKWNIATFFEEYRASSSVLVDDTGVMMWESLWLEKSKDGFHSYFCKDTRLHCRTLE